MRRRARPIPTGLTIACLAALCGCAIPAQPPGLLVITAPPGASCVLARQGQTIAVADPTPAIARGLDSGAGPVTITCARPGFANTSVAVAPEQPAGTYPERIEIALLPGLPSAVLWPPSPAPPPR
jgi:hypothetical protein